MNNLFFIEVGFKQKNHFNERICGDVFLSKKVKEDNRTIIVLSDGLGHGIKAHLLATLTATMALNFTVEHKDVHKIAEIIMNTLPVCSERKISYSTFTIVDIAENGQTTIINYENPDCIILRGNEVFEPKWHMIEPENEQSVADIRKIKACSFNVLKGDRIVLVTDGVTQSGLGSGEYLFGFGWDNTRNLVEKLVTDKPVISASNLASKIINRVHSIDRLHSKDDTSCAVMYFREPRKLLICSGPPYTKERDDYLYEKVRDFSGTKIISGGTTADIIAAKFNITIKDTIEFDDPELPPVSYIEGIDLVTEGILTLSKVSLILQNYSDRTELGRGPADRIAKLLIDSDVINICVGTAINVAHQDPNLPVELEIRRNVLKKIASILEDKFLKEVVIEFI